MNEEMKENKLPPRIHCFSGPRVDLNDVCSDFEKCQTIRCMWHKNRDKSQVRRGADDNKTEAMTRTSI